MPTNQPPSNAHPPSSSGTIAVAIEADRAKQTELPRIVAAGRGALAEQILALAFENGVKVRQDASLAQILVQLELESPIPSEAIVAVAEILAKVYEANQRVSPDAPAPIPMT